MCRLSWHFKSAFPVEVGNEERSIETNDSSSLTLAKGLGANDSVKGHHNSYSSFILYKISPFNSTGMVLFDNAAWSSGQHNSDLGRGSIKP